MKNYMRGCGNCRLWKPEDNPKLEQAIKDRRLEREGDCSYEVVFPDAVFGRSTGMRRKMRETEGLNCPVREPT